MNLTWRKLLRLMATFKSHEERLAVASSTPDQARRAAEARRVMRHSRALLDKVESREQAVDSLHRSMREIGEQNGFASLILKSLGGGAR